MPFRSRRRSVRRFGPKSRRSFRRRGGLRRGRALRSRTIRDFKSVAREFLWGSFSVAAGAPNSPNLVTPTQSVPFVAAPTVDNGWNLGISQTFQLSDMPASFITYVREFDYFKIVKVSLKFKPRWNNVTMDTTATTNGPVSAPRLYFHTQHDNERLMSQIPTSADDIMRYPDHTIYDLTQQRMYHLKPSTMMPTTVVGPAATAIQALTPAYRKWQATLTDVGGTPTPTDPPYFGLQAWLEWYNPPAAPATPGTNDSIIDIYATYTVQMKEHHE